MKTIRLHAGETLTLGDHSIRFTKHGFHAEGQGPSVPTVELEIEGPDEDAAVTVDDAGL